MHSVVEEEELKAHKRRRVDRDWLQGVSHDVTIQQPMRMSLLDPWERPLPIVIEDK